ncbi:aldo/keto reductase [Actinomycetospora soli]|uniref:aldo/keto reductase n=1 Tax=Actinomycetospora soli TaxID=2893887 RepID=UPI001E506C48|nr:aldo/keto reductase [Actinomycetospora soli]MCD2189858.1 aldo/keto reductase [Actinomycetospora soli]
MTALPDDGLCLGGNVFGWTADEPTSHALLDAFVDAGGRMIDTADSYMARAEGNSGGESETVIGNWLARTGRRDDVVIATKVGSWEQRKGLRPENIRAACDDSLRRLQTDHIDLYYAHRDDPDTPQEDYVGAFDELVRAGKVRAVGASNFDADRLACALELADKHDLTRFSAVQPHYNLVERDYERDLAPLVEREGLVCYPYFGLAKGFLTGKYRPGSDQVDSGASSGAMASARAEGARAYLDDHGVAVLGVLDEIAAAHDVPVAAVSLAWLAAQPTVGAPIASGRTLAQLGEILPAVSLRLSDDELRRLSAA